MLKRSTAAFIDDATLDREWKKLNFLSKPHFAKAREEYQNFEALVTSGGVESIFLPVSLSLSIDSLYCRDASIVTDHGVVLCNMGKANRAGEPTAEAELFELNGIRILGEITAPGTLEGGDCAWIDHNTLAVGHTYRTNEEGIRQLKALVEPHGIEVLVAHMPHYRGQSDVFHLMSVLSPIDRDLAVVYSSLMPIHFRNELIKRGYGFVEVPDSEFDSMGCNVLAIAPRRVLMVKGNPVTKQRLVDAGCKVFEYDGAEISVKGGGGPTCLTRPIEREY